MNIFATSRIDKNKKLNSLQYLRVFAVLSVIFFHIEEDVIKKYWVIDEYAEFFNWGQDAQLFVFQDL